MNNPREYRMMELYFYHIMAEENLMKHSHLLRLDILQHYKE
eukprot:CAMPEP_0114696382 /NCGR_PEP_ID=MMETSP0191-20121206/72496_1 /TAXON_ID=126664 /ORGANISM="Sorites sp." /LENGTH=40 /DNA_ID= /DNA_START= /DNA_END= /DNA_ORIENTATION=